MVKKRHFLLLALCFMSVLAACATGSAKRYLGRSLPASDINPLAGAEGTDVYTSKSFANQYHYAIDPGNGRLALDCTVTSVVDPAKHPFGAVLNRLKFEEIMIDVLFTDDDGKVIDVQRICGYPKDQIFRPASFNGVLSYSPAYRGMSMRIIAYMHDGILRITSHQLEAYKGDFRK